MNSQLFYKAMAGFYDLLDVIYFRNHKKSPRRVVFHSIDDSDRVLDLCTGTATNALKIAKAKPFKTVIKRDLPSYFKQHGFQVISETYCDYSKVLRLKKNLD